MFVPLLFCWRDAGLFQTEQNRFLVIRQLLPILSFPKKGRMIWTGDGRCSCQNFRTVSLPEMCNFFWGSSNRFMLSWCCHCLQVPAKASGPASLRNGFHIAERRPYCHVDLNFFARGHKFKGRNEGSHFGGRKAWFRVRHLKIL